MNKWIESVETILGVSEIKEKLLFKNNNVDNDYIGKNKNKEYTTIKLGKKLKMRGDSGWKKSEKMLFSSKILKEKH